MPAADLLGVLKALRDEHGFDMLVDVTAVDWAADANPRFTVVYHVFSTAWHEYVRVAADCADDAAPEVPSVTALWPGADWHEREAYDMFGIRFAGHPDLRRILMWDGYPALSPAQGFPARGHRDGAAGRGGRRRDEDRGHRRADDGRPLRRLPGRDQHDARPSRAPRTRAGPSAARNPEPDPTPHARRIRISRRRGEERRAASSRPRRCRSRWGPSHPSTHGVLRLQLELDGEVVTKADPVIGYLHRGDEKIAENMTYNQFVPYTDRLDYLAPLANNMAYAIAVEKLAKLEVPPRCQAIRVITAEMARISAHLLGLGAFGIDVGAWTVFLYSFTEREKLYKLFEELTGARFTTSYTRIGGVAARRARRAGPSRVDAFCDQFLPHPGGDPATS